MPLIWYGDQIRERITMASRMGIDDTMAAAANTAETLSGLPPGRSRDSITVLAPAATRSGRTAGWWGSRYFLVYIYEVGSFRAASGWDIRNRPRGGKRVLASRSQVYGRTVHHPFLPGRAFLRRAADATYPTLGRRIAAHFIRGR